MTPTASQTHAVRPRSSVRPHQVCDVGVLVVGLAILVTSVVQVARSGWDVPPAALLAVPLVVVIARFPVVTNAGEGGIEVGFDSAVLMFLACTLDPWAAVLLWSLGVLVTQLTHTGKRVTAVVFNIGVGITAGAIATAVLDRVVGDDVSGLRELVGVLLAATAYFATDLVVSGVSVALEMGSSVWDSLVRPGTWTAIGWFVPFDLLGYLGAVLSRATPWWTLLLLTVPLATLLVAARAISHGREDARRLQVLLDSAVDSQTLSEPRQVVDALLLDARRLLRLDELEIRRHGPGDDEIGAQVRAGDDATWVVGPAQRRARSTPLADQRALAALCAVSAAAFNRLALTEDLVHLARHDPLTDLPNRAVFMDRLNYALLMSARGGGSVALLFVDLDGFKPVNDRFGHAAGDAVLVDVGARLAAGVRGGDTVARLGGDEFAVLLEGLGPDEVLAVSRRILEAITAGVDVGGHQVSVSASIGVALAAPGEHADQVLRNADLAMYEAKAGGKNRFVLYEPDMLAGRLARLDLVEDLGEALEQRLLTVVYQTITSATTGRVRGVEALARWRHRDCDIPPDVFVRVAEETGMVSALGELVLDRVAHDAHDIREAAGHDLAISVNISPSQLVDPDFAGAVERTVARLHGVHLVLELTEREGVGREPGALAAMHAISELGVSIAIDDFGVGFSSLSYLREIPARVVKIDASLSQGIDLDDEARGLLRSVMAMARALGHEVVIEGIERQSQLDLVRADSPLALVQGYLLHRPAPVVELLGTLRHEAHRDAGSPTRRWP